VAAEKAAVRREALDLGALETLVGYHARRAQALIYERYAEAMGGTGVRPVQFAALTLISANPGLNQSALSATLGIERSNAVALVDGLEAQGWIRRAAATTDRRAFALKMTASGGRRLAIITAQVLAFERQLTRRLSTGERRQLLLLLRRLWEQ